MASPRLRLLLRLASLGALFPLFCMKRSAAQSPPARVEYTDQIIIKFRDAKTARAASIGGPRMKTLSAAGGVRLAHLRPMSGDSQVLKLPGRLPIGEVKAILAKLAADPDVEYALPDRIRRPTLTPNDPLYANQWHYKSTASFVGGADVAGAWNMTTGSAGVVVAVIDTGIRPHADLAGRTVPGYDFIVNLSTANDGNGRDNDPTDPGDWTANGDCDPLWTATDSSWHGTHVAGTIGAAGNNGVGVAGINWNSKILPVRVLGKCGGYDSDIIDGSRWAAGLSVSGIPVNANPAKVLNLSLGGPDPCPAAYQTAIDQILAAGAVFVVAAGNNGHDASLDTPGSCNGVITVAAVNKTGARASYSNYGTVVELAAPGGDTGGGNGVYSTSDSGLTSPSADSYKYLYGTSMAAPHVAGVVSLMLSVNPALTPAQVLSKLQSSARAFPTGTGRDCTTSTCGSGMLDAAAAVRSAAALPSAPSGFSAYTLGTSSALWTWSLSADATYYAVYSATDTSSLLGTSTGPYFLRTGLSPNTTYAIFARGVNIAGDPGTGSASLSTATLSLPLTGTLASVDISSIAVSFTPLAASPSSSSASGTLLEVSTSPSFAGAVFSSRTASLAVSALAASGLAEYTTYYLRLASLNSLGGANFSNAGSTLTRTALVAPGTGPISGVSDTAFLSGWTAGNNTAGLQYTIYASTASDFSGTLLSSATYSLSALFSSLSPDSTYHLRVRATGGPYTYLGSTVTLAAPPGAGSAAFSAVYAASMSVAWSSGSNAQGTRYSTQLSSSAGFTAGVFSSSTYAASASFTGLWPNTSYFLRVWSVNRAGSPNGPVLSSSSTLAQAPSSLVQLTVSVTSITLAFAAFPPSPSSVSCWGYLLEASTDSAFEGAVASTRTANITLSTLTASGLDAYATYYLRLASLNERGSPDFTALGSTLTLTMLVAPGTAPFSGVTATGAQANWTVGANPSGLQYVAQASTSPDFTGTLASSSTYAAFAAFGSLAADTTWYFRVRAATGPFAVLGATLTLAYTPEEGAPTFSSVFPSSLTVSWSSGGNSSGTLYLAELSSVAALSAGIQSFSTLNRFAVFSALDSNTTHYLRVRSFNRAGSPSPSFFASTSTLSAAPQAASPSYILGFSSITLRWTPLPGSPSTATCEGYQAEVSTAADFTGRIIYEVARGSAVSQLAIGNLSYGTTYHLRVGALNWSGGASYASLGSTRTLVGALSSAPVTNASALIVALIPLFPQISRVQVDVPIGALPDGTSLTVDAGPALIPSPQSSQAALTALGSGVGVDISAGGAQPTGPVMISMTYETAWLPAGADPKRLAIARYVSAEDKWSLLATTVDTASRLLRAQTRHFSLFAPFLVAAGSGLGSVQVFPVPWEPDTGDPGFDAPYLTFSGLPQDGSVRLHTLQGERVWEASASPAGIVLWNGRNDHGGRAASGTYLAVISGGGAKVVRRVVLIR